MTQYMMYPPNDQLIQIIRANEETRKNNAVYEERQAFWIEFLKRNEELQLRLIDAVDDLTRMIRVKR